MSLYNNLFKALKESEFHTSSSRTNGKYLSELTCPECGEKKAWAYAAKPLAIICNRNNKCGARTKTIPLFNISAKLEKQYPPTEEDPHRPAREFLKLRGLPDELIKKVEYEYHNKTRKGCGGGVFFPLELKKIGKKRLCTGRLFAPPDGHGKTHNTGTLDSKHWQLDDKEYKENNPTYVTEGVIDALSLIAMGKQAIAVVAAGSKPDNFNLAKFGELVFALDNDAAGTKFTKKWLAYCKENEMPATAIMPVKGDWNDLLCNAETPEKAAQRFDKDYERYKVEAELALAETAQKYAEIYVNGKEGFAPGFFAFKGCYYWSWVKEVEGVAKVFTKRASNFTITVKHYQLSESDKELPVFSYRLKVKPNKGRSFTVTATGNDLKSPDSLTGFFLRHSKAHWRGQADAAKAFAEMVVSSNAPIIRQAEFIGYDHDSGYHVLKDIAISPTGKTVYLEKGGFFKIGHNQYLRPAQIETIKPEKSEINKLYNLLIQAWGSNAAVAVAFLVASMFVNMVKPVTKFFPFLSMYGDPQSGKSRLLILLNAMQCLDEEGLPMTSGSTKKGELRTLAQLSGMAKGMIEGNDPRRTQFDFESILPLYNIGNPLQLRAAYSNDNRVIKMMFHGTLIFVQNMEPFKSRAAKERIISLKFSTDDLGDTTKAAYDQLIALPLQEVAGFLQVIKKRSTFEKQWEGYFETAKADLMPSIPDNRINENHALLLAFHRIFCKVFKIEHNLQPYLEKIGKKKMISCQQRSLTPADYFFDALNELPECLTTEIGESYSYRDDFYHIKDNNLYLNRIGAEKAIRAAGIVLDYPERLGKALQEHPAFLEGSKGHRFPGPSVKNVRAMVFDIRRMST